MTFFNNIYVNDKYVYLFIYKYFLLCTYILPKFYLLSLTNNRHLYSECMCVF